VDPLFIVAVLAVGAGLLPWLHRRGEKKPLALESALALDWEAAAADRGLDDAVTTDDGGTLSLTATLGPLRIVLKPWYSDWPPGTHVVVSGLATGLEARRQAEAGLSLALGARDFEIGDRRFDEAVVVDAEKLLAFALLDAETRGILGDVVLARGAFERAGARLKSLRKGQMVAICLGEPIATRSKRLAEALRILLALGESLATPAAIEERIAANLASEPEAAVRQRGLAALGAERPGHPATRNAARVALTDADEDVRFTAALTAGDEGLAVLRAIACDGSIRDATRARAIAALGTALDGAEAQRILCEALRTNQKTTIACLESPVLARMPQVEPVLIDALAHSSAVVREASAMALGRVGSAAGVVALRKAESQGRLLRRTARDAVASIQSRLVGAERGQLSVASDAGELSLADDAAGRVTVEDAS